MNHSTDSILGASTWAHLATAAAISSADSMIAKAESDDIYPVSVELETMTTDTGLSVPGKAVVATYASGRRQAHSAMKDRYTPLSPAEWRATLRATADAGATPLGVHSLGSGGRILAQFEIPGSGSGIRNIFNVADSLDGSLAFCCGGTSVRYICANTLAGNMGAVRIKHTGSINSRAEQLRGAIELHVREGETVAKLYADARNADLTRREADAVFALLFPVGTEEDSQRKATRLANVRKDAVRSMKRRENFEGGNLATLWNAATWMVDRTASGTTRNARGGADRVESMLFGSRAKRVTEIKSIIQVVLADGCVTDMEASEASAHGVDDHQIGSGMMESMLDAARGNYAD